MNGLMAEIIDNPHGDHIPRAAASTVTNPPDIGAVDEEIGGARDAGWIRHQFTRTDLRPMCGLPAAGPTLMA